MVKTLLSHPALAAVRKVFLQEGAEAYLVGGAVRDFFDGKGSSSPDLDITTPLLPEEVKKLVKGLGSISDVGQRFGTIGVYIPVSGELVPVEITTHRKEEYTEGSRKPQVSMLASLYDDLSRRDFTLNAMAINLATEEVVDFFDGMGALRDGVLKTPLAPGKTFKDDPLRMCRALRFSVTRGWSIEEKAKASIKQLSDELRHVAVERVFAETQKALSSTRGGSFKELLSLSESLGLAKYILPGADVKSLVCSDDVLPQDRLTYIYVNESVKKQSRTGGAVAMRPLKPSNDISKRVSDVSEVLLSPDVRRSVRKHSREVILQSIRVGNALGANTEELSLTETSLGENLRGKLPLDGLDVMQLGLNGKAVGEALKKVETAFLENPELSKSEAIKLVSV